MPHPLGGGSGVNQVTRVAIVILALYWLVAGLAGLPRELADILIDPSVQFDAMQLVGVASFVLLFAILPATILLRLSQRIADRLFPEQAVSPDFSPAAAYLIGCTLLSYFLMIEGGVLIVWNSAVVSLLRSEDPDYTFYFSKSAASLVSGAFQLGLGFLLYRHAMARRPPGSIV